MDKKILKRTMFNLFVCKKFANLFKFIAKFDAQKNMMLLKRTMSNLTICIQTNKKKKITRKSLDHISKEDCKHALGKWVQRLRKCHCSGRLLHSAKMQATNWIEVSEKYFNGPRSVSQYFILCLFIARWYLMVPFISDLPSYGVCLIRYWSNGSTSRCDFVVRVLLSYGVIISSLVFI